MVVATGSVTVSMQEQDFIRQLVQSQEAVEDFLKEVAKEVRDNAKASADFADKTGNLRKSIGMRKSKFVNGGYIVKASGRNRQGDSEGAKGFHAWLVEFGHVTKKGTRTRPRSFMRNALKKAQASAVSKITSMRG